jgi:hypothetical protein
MTNTKIDNLVAGKRYFVDVWWNLYNTVRDCEPYQFVGEFQEINYIPTKRETNDHGLVIVTAPARTEVIFSLLDHYGIRQNKDIRVSSMNHFYSSYRPKSIELCHRCAIMKLRLPLDIRRYMRTFMEKGQRNLRKILQIEKRNGRDMKPTNKQHVKRTKHTQNKRKIQPG